MKKLLLAFVFLLTPHSTFAENPESTLEVTFTPVHNAERVKVSTGMYEHKIADITLTARSSQVLRVTDFEVTRQGSGTNYDYDSVYAMFEGFEKSNTSPFFQIKERNFARIVLPSIKRLGDGDSISFGLYVVNAKGNTIAPDETYQLANIISNATSTKINDQETEKALLKIINGQENRFHDMNAKKKKVTRRKVRRLTRRWKSRRSAKADTIDETTTEETEPKATPRAKKSLKRRRPKRFLQRKILQRKNPSASIPKTKQEVKDPRHLAFFQENPTLIKAKRIKISNLISTEFTSENYTEKAKRIAEEDENATFFSYEPKPTIQFNDKKLAQKLQETPAGEIIPVIVETITEPIIKKDEKSEKLWIKGGWRPILGIVRVTEKTSTKIPAYKPEGSQTIVEEKVGYDILAWETEDFRWEKIPLNGSHIEKISHSGGQSSKIHTISIRLTEEGRNILNQVTKRMANQSCENRPCLLGIKVGDRWVSTASIEEIISGREVIITAKYFTADDVKAISNNLNIGTIAGPQKPSPSNNHNKQPFQRQHLSPRKSLKRQNPISPKTVTTTSSRRQQLLERIRDWRLQRGR